MIAEPVRGNDFRGIFAYHEKKVQEGVAKEIGRSENLVGLETGEIIADFDYNVHEYKENQKKGRELERWTFHPHLDFHSKDGSKISDELLNKIADRYMKGMGYGNCEYVIYRHDDKEHPHIHIVSSVIDRDGVRVDKTREKYKSFAICRILEKEFGLVVATDNKRDLQAEYERHQEEIEKIKTGKIKDLDLKYSYGAEMLINRAVNMAFDNSEIQDYNAYKKFLNKQGVEAVKVEKEGKVIGLKYSIVNDDLSRYSINASKTGKRATLNRLDVLFKKNKGLEKEVVRTVIDQALNRGAYNIPMLRKQLALDGVNLVAHENKGGVYGLSFEKDGKVYKGSELGKKGYSFNDLKDKLQNNIPGRAEKGEVVMDAVRKAIDTALKTRPYDLASLRAALLLQGVGLVEAKNASGTYGLSFEKDGVKVKGSELNQGYNKKYSFKAIMDRLQKNNPENVVRTAYEGLNKNTSSLGLLVQLYAKGVELEGGEFKTNDLKKGVQLDKVVEKDKIKGLSNFEGHTFLKQKLNASEKKLILAMFTIDNLETGKLQRVSAINEALTLMGKGTKLRLPEEVKQSFGKETMKIVNMADSLAKQNTPVQSAPTSKGFNVGKGLADLLGLMDDSGTGKKKKKKDDDDEENQYNRTL